MKKAKDYEKNGSGSARILLAGLGVVLSAEKDVICTKCHKPILPNEMFCLDCFGEKPSKTERYRPPKPDDPGGLFDGV